MTDISIQKKNEVYLYVECEPHIKYELSDYFTFEVPSAKYHPMYKNKLWDGKIRLFSPGTGEIYIGLIKELIKFAEDRNYSYEFLNNKFYGMPIEIDEELTPKSLFDEVNNFNINLDIRDYQYNSIYKGLKNKRKLILSPTGSGKSLLIYCITRFLVERDNKILIIVPNVSLVEQIYKEFSNYGWNVNDYCHKIYAGKEKITNHAVTISTWQSMVKLPKKYFDDFTSVIVDECHLAKAKSITNIMNKMHQAKYRIGFTGTLDGTQTNLMVLEGLFGPVENVTKTKNLIQKGYLSNLKIKIFLIKHDYKKFESYQEEIDYIISNNERNNFIKNIVSDITGNTLILFSMVEKHGKYLYELIKNSLINQRKVFFVYGKTDVHERELIREITEKENNAVIIASYGTFSTGINIKNLHNVIFASPSKSRIRNLQSIGRVLRISENKTHATLYDIADDISRGSKKNYTLQHLVERIKQYNEENFDYEIIDKKI